MFKRYLSNLLIATWALLLSIDKFANSIAGGDPQELISSRVGKMVRIWKQSPQNKARFLFANALCRFLSWFEKEHCEKSIQVDEGANDLWATRKLEIAKRKAKRRKS